MHGCLMFDWDDLKYFLAVARHGSTIAAGKALGLSQSTVHRRLSELERRLNRKLVTRETTVTASPTMPRNFCLLPSASKRPSSSLSAMSKTRRAI